MSQMLIYIILPIQSILLLFFAAVQFDSFLLFRLSLEHFGLFDFQISIVDRIS